jgi:hypothetical protein
MDDLLSHLVDAPLANIIVLAGLAFLAIGVLGKISSKIEPNTTGRVLSAVVGVALLIFGIYSHRIQDAKERGRGVAMTQTPAQPSQRNPGPMVEGRLFGVWKNTNPQTRGITRLEVQQNGGLVAVRAWGACSPRDCDWGMTTGIISGESASARWDQGFVERKMAFSPDGNRLRMVLDSVYRDNRPPQHGLEYFVKQ